MSAAQYAQISREVARSLPPRIRAIIHTVAEEHGVTADDILGQSRRRKPVQARWVAMQACLDLVMSNGRAPSIAQVGRWFGRDHTTVMHAIRKIGPVQLEMFAA